MKFNIDFKIAFGLATDSIPADDTAAATADATTTLEAVLPPALLVLVDAMIKEFAETVAKIVSDEAKANCSIPPPFDELPPPPAAPAIDDDVDDDDDDDDGPPHLQNRYAEDDDSTVVPDNGVDDDSCSQNLLESSSDEEEDDDSDVPDLVAVAATIEVDYNNNVDEFEQVNELSQTFAMLTARSRTRQDFKKTKREMRYHHCQF